MTEYYNAKEVDSRHLVFFPKPDEDIEYYYYVFEEKKWVRCYPIDNLPYDLCSFRLEGKTNEEAVVTCNDSYRLKDYLPNEEYFSHEDMLEEKEWRDSIVKDDAEMDFRLSKGWTKAKVCWTKSDIIPGVVVIGPRKRPNLNSYGYFYKESLKLAKSCTYTPVITEEELDEEKRRKEEAQLRIDKKKAEANAWKKKIGLQVPEKYKNARGFLLGPAAFCDTLPIYQSLEKYPEPVTLDKLKEAGVSELKKPDKIYKLTYCSMEFVELQKKYKVVYHNEERKIKSRDGVKEAFCLCHADAYADIKIFGATWAYMWCGDGHAYPDEDFRKFEMEKVEDGDSSYFTFTDITYENPLFGIAGLYFYTDGNLTTYKAIIFNKEVKDLFRHLGNCYEITHFPKRGRMLFRGHLWQPSYSCAYDELISVPIPEEKEERSPRVMII